MENEENKVSGTEASDGVDVNSLNQGGSTRRRFGKHALGAAVILTVANRVAWGTVDGFSSRKGGGDKEYEKACISQRTWDSYKKGSASQGPGGNKFSKEIQNFQSFVNQGDYALYEKNGSVMGDQEYCAVREVDSGPRRY